ncbi:DNA methylase [Bdellovibrio bacteriovorus]|uniref:Methyltransferase n=1 Tax=Bdellovibrio bacteriovorus TaxID=959 RepID=A0A162GD23_BDEBC|nr:site-specific DNA-methyltransferase [Bdellovibrio bacteriovorus]KYG67843.1 DNA methylase [Bdellovibrio bacteriovorus]
MDANHLASFLDQIICGDALETLQKIPDCSIDLAVTSPPYNLKNSSGNGLKDGRGGKWSKAALLKGYPNHDDNMPHTDYVRWQRAVIAETLRTLKSDGALFYIHKWRVQNGVLQDRQDIVSGFPVRQIIIWQRAGGINFNPGYFLPTYEVIYLIAKPEFKLSPQANACGDVWSFSQEMNNDHPSPFPLALAERIISSTEAKTILDPFIGSGTTAVAAKKLGRQYIGIDIAQEYCKVAEERVRDFNISKIDPFKNKLVSTKGSQSREARKIIEERNLSFFDDLDKSAENDPEISL